MAYSLKFVFMSSCTRSFLMGKIMLSNRLSAPCPIRGRESESSWKKTIEPEFGAPCLVILRQLNVFAFQLNSGFLRKLLVR